MTTNIKSLKNLQHITGMSVFVVLTKQKKIIKAVRQLVLKKQNVQFVQLNMAKQAGMIMKV